MKQKRINWNSIIEKRNRQWDESTTLQKKLTICNEVIMMINAKRIKVEQGVYCNNTGDLDGHSAEDIQKELIEGQLVCTACARGSMMLAKFTFSAEHDDYSKSLYDILDNGQQDDTTNALEEAFTEDELDKIETIFESNNMYYEDTDDDEYPTSIFGNVYSDEEAEEYTRKFAKNPTKKLKQIMERIIMCNGDVDKALTCDMGKKIKFPVQ